jgi:predicted ArsR family transcriptional regulator
MERMPVRPRQRTADRLLRLPKIAVADAGAGRTVLHNCPFRPVAAQAPDLICGMNHAFLRGCLAASGHPETTAVLTPRPGICCVELHTDR